MRLQYLNRASRFDNGMQLMVPTLSIFRPIVAPHALAQQCHNIAHMAQAIAVRQIGGAVLCGRPWARDLR